METRDYNIPPEKMKPLPPKPAIKSKTVQGTIGEVVGAALIAVGIAQSPDFIFDGWQTEEDLTEAIGLGFGLAGYFWRRYGERAAKQAIEGFFRTKRR